MKKLFTPFNMRLVIFSYISKAFAHAKCSATRMRVNSSTFATRGPSKVIIKGFVKLDASGSRLRL